MIVGYNRSNASRLLKTAFGRRGLEPRCIWYTRRIEGAAAALQRGRPEYPGDVRKRREALRGLVATVPQTSRQEARNEV